MASQCLASLRIYGHAPKSKKEAIQTSITIQQQLEFERKGHICIRKFFPPSNIQALHQSLTNLTDDELLAAYRHRLSVLCPGIDPSMVLDMKQAQSLLRKKVTYISANWFTKNIETYKLRYEAQGTDEVGFLQIFNLHRKKRMIKEFTHFSVLCAAVSKLLNTEKVRLYQDCLFIKFPGFDVTNWHSDLNMVPLDTNSFLTVWIPLHNLSSSDSSLHFASGSHRDFALPYWKSNEGMASLEERGYPIHTYRGLSAGDLTIHHGWTLHWAPPQPMNCTPRFALAISYFADGARVLSTKNARRQVQEEDMESFKWWKKNLKEGQTARHPLLPLVHPT